jgi:hypothetical protein
MAMRRVEKTEDGLRRNLAHGQTAALRMSPQPDCSLLGHFDRDRERGRSHRNRRFQCLRRLKVAISLPARNPKLLAQGIGGSRQGIPLCQQVERGIQPMRFLDMG